MEALISLEIGLISWLQSVGKLYMMGLRLFSFMGTEQFFLLIIPVIYWCVDSGLGLRLGVYMMLTSNLNLCLKLLFHAPRPYWISSSVKGLEYEPSFAFPSGHSQNAAVFCPALASGYLKARNATANTRKLIWVIAILVILLIGLSRVFLGMHFPHDVLAGFLVGFLSLLIFARLFEPVSVWMQKQRLVAQILILFAFSLVLIMAGILSLTITWISGFQLPIEWITNSASPGKPPLNPFELSPIITGAAGFFGLGAGACFIKAKGGFMVSGAPSALLFRYFLGMAGLLILWSGLGIVFPRGKSLVPYLLRFFRYSLAGFWATGLAPLLFIKLRIAGKPAENE